MAVVHYKSKQRGGRKMDRPWMQYVADGNPKEIPIPDLSLTELLNQTIEQYPNHIAMTYFKETYTYTDLKNAITKTALALQEKGLKKGERVAIMLPNSPQYPISFYAALTCGAIVVQVNPMYQASELIHILNDSGTKVLIVLDKLMPLVNSIRSQTALEDVISISIDNGKMPDELTANPTTGLQRATIDPKEDVAVLQYTGGTTGTPKGAMLTHFNVVANTLQSAATGHVNIKVGEERVLTVIPLFHVYGMTSGMCLTFHIGGNLILVPKFEVEQIVSLIETVKPTSFPGVPTMYIALLDYYKKKKFELSSLNVCSSGSAPLPPEVIDRFNQVSGTKVAEGYGLSEASPTTHRNPVSGLQKIGSIGIPIQNTDAKIVDIATGEKTLSYGEVGELVIKGPQIMKGYWNKPEETSHAIRNGWLHTGDLATMDADGFFFIVGRKKEMIIASGYNIYPIEVENVIYTHPAVLEAAVIGVPDEYRGETVYAVVALKEGRTLTKEELIVYCRKHLSAFKVPVDVDFVDELPKTAVGKILKRTLQEQYRKRSAHSK